MRARNGSIAWGPALSLFVAGLSACTSPDSDSAPLRSQEQKAAAERAWTRQFQEQSILSAREVSIEGPPGLIDHVAFKQLPDQKYSAKTIAEGFLQEVSAGEEAVNPIWIQIDNLAIAVDRRARVLERLGPGPVRIQARGDVYWKSLATGEEQRADTLELVGPPAQ